MIQHQVLNRAVAWGLLDFNPAKRGGPNPQRRPKEKRPFESWAQLEAIAAQLGTLYGPMVIFGAATGLRPSERSDSSNTTSTVRPASSTCGARSPTDGSRTPRPG